MVFACSGDEALQRIEAFAGTTLVLILSDINMPGMSGLNLLPKVKAARPNVPLNVSAGTLNPHLPKRTIAAAQILEWLEE
jgi:CheY-like chemotaxis protein